MAYYYSDIMMMTMMTMITMTMMTMMLDMMMMAKPVYQYIYYSKWAINVTVIPPSAV